VADRLDQNPCCSSIRIELTDGCILFRTKNLKSLGIWPRMLICRLLPISEVSPDLKIGVIELILNKF
jgi:hypothetical protein